MRKRKTFTRRNANRLKRLRTGWRKPKGRHSKIRRKKKSIGSMPNKGYMSSKAIKGLHPSGLPEVRIENFSDVEKLENNAKVAARIAAGIGNRKKTRIVEMLNQKKIKILNGAVK